MATVKVGTKTDKQKAYEQQIRNAAAATAAMNKAAELGTTVYSTTQTNEQKRAINQAAQNAAMTKQAELNLQPVYAATELLNNAKNPVSGAKTGFSTNLNDPNAPKVQVPTTHSGRVTTTLNTGAQLTTAAKKDEDTPARNVDIPTTPQTYSAPVQEPTSVSNYEPVSVPTYTPTTTQIEPYQSKVSEVGPYQSSLEKPTYQGYSAEKPTYTSSYEKSSYTPQTYSAQTYSGASYSGRSYQGQTFEPSAVYLEAMEEANKLREELKGGRTSFTDKVNAKLEEIENTKPFEYDFNKDTLFQNALAAYMRSGRVAMQDTMGQAAALTGGYGSSYSQAVGNQAYNNMVQEAYDNLPEYYQIAYQKYQDDLANKYNLLNEYRSSDETEYGRKYNDYNMQYGYAADQYARELEKANFDEQSRQWAQSLTEQSAQHAQSLTAQAAMQAQSLTAQDRRWAAEMNQSEQRYADQLAREDEQREYDRFLNELSQWNNERNFSYQQFLNDLDQYNTDRSFDYGTYRDQVSDARYADQTDYERWLDLYKINDAAEQKNYDRYRDSVGDARYADETSYSRAENADNKAYSRAIDERNFNYNAGQDAINNSLKASANALNWKEYDLKKEAQTLEKEYQDWQKKQSEAEREWEHQYKYDALASDEAIAGMKASSSGSKTNNLPTNAVNNIKSVVNAHGLVGDPTDPDFEKNNKQVWNLMTSLINQGYDENEVFDTFIAAEAARDKSYSYKNGNLVDGTGRAYTGSDANEWKPAGYDEVHKVTMYENGAGVQMSEKDLEAKYGSKQWKKMKKGK